MILCLGAKNSGKTVLLKRLQEANFASLNNFSEMPTTVPTVGTNIVYLKLPNLKEAITIEEIGGEMSPIWSNYFSSCSAFLYLIDSSNLTLVTETFLSLLPVLKYALQNEKPVHLILSKTDVKSLITPKELLDDILFLDSLLKTTPKQRLDFTECSCITGKGLKQVFDWIKNFEKAD